MANPNKRRNFLLAAAAGTALSAFPEAIRRALAIPAHQASGTIDDVQHVVILMQENRSFDHYLGTLPGVRGFADRFTIPQAGGAPVWLQNDGKRAVAPYYLDYRQGNALLAGGAHTWNDAHAAWDHGRMTHWPQYKGDVSMGYLNHNDLPFHFALANAFTVCDAYYCSLQGGTNTNRMFMWTGSNGPGPAGVSVINNDKWDNLAPSVTGLTWSTYPERLQAAGVSWKVYQNQPDNYTDNPLAGFKRYRALNEKLPGSPLLPYSSELEAVSPLYKAIGNTMPDGGFLQALKDDIGAGQLPQVSWIISPQAYCEHPEVSTPGQGAWYIQQLLDALTADPEVWSKTVLIVNYDENDCFFDHLPPPVAPSKNPDGSLAGKSTVETRDEYFNFPTPPGNAAQERPDGLPFGAGPRVPMFVISPWSCGGWVNSQVFDHTSVLRFLEQRFGVIESNISAWRRAVFGDLTSAFNFKNPNRVRRPRLPKQNRAGADALSARQHEVAKIAVPVPFETELGARQARLSRPSRALPYELQVHAEIADGSLNLSLINSGDCGAVFHVYDRLHLDRIPRRYTVEAGKQLADRWDARHDAGNYDLWVLGPNGFHRAFQGNAAVVANGANNVEVVARYDVAQNSLYLKLSNSGNAAVTFEVTAHAYFKGGPWHHVVDAQAGVEPHWNLSAAGGWYDFSVSTADGFMRRFAGRLETGEDSVSDPAMGA